MMWTFSEETLHAMHLLQAIFLGEAMTGDILTLYISKLLDSPV